MNFKLTEKEIIKILEEARQWRNYHDFASYLAEDEYELLEYKRVDPEDSGLKTTLWLDDGSSYIVHNHPLWVYMEDEEVGHIIPISVCENPQIMLPGFEKKDIREVKRFILNNIKNIIKLANEEIFSLDLIDVFHEDVINESYNILFSKIPSKVTGLPTEIWVDEGNHPQHGKRIKFRASKEQQTTKEYSTITIADEPMVLNLPKKGCISNDKINLIKKFVYYNKELLADLSDGKIKLKNDFIKKMIKIDKNGNPIYPQSFFDKPLNIDEKNNNKDVKKKKYNK